MSTKVIRAGIIFAEFAICARLARRASGTLTSPTLGSIVQNGKFAACAEAVLVSALNKVDLPTFGKPTIPIRKPMMHSFIFQTALICAGHAGQAELRYPQATTNVTEYSALGQIILNLPRLCGMS
jgi:hypothetical protein